MAAIAQHAPGAARQRCPQPRRAERPDCDVQNVPDLVEDGWRFRHLRRRWACGLRTTHGVERLNEKFGGARVIRIFPDDVACQLLASGFGEIPEQWATGRTTLNRQVFARRGKPRAISRFSGGLPRRRRDELPPAAQGEVSVSSLFVCARPSWEAVRERGGDAIYAR